MIETAVVENDICENSVLNLAINVEAALFVWKSFFIFCTSDLVLNRGVIHRKVLSVNFRHHLVAKVSIREIVQGEVGRIQEDHGLSRCTDLVGKQLHGVRRVFFLATHAQRLAQMVVGVDLLVQLVEQVVLDAGGS